MHILHAADNIRALQFHPEVDFTEDERIFLQSFPHTYIFSWYIPFVFPSYVHLCIYIHMFSMHKHFVATHSEVDLT